MQHSTKRPARQMNVVLRDGQLLKREAMRPGVPTGWGAAPVAAPAQAKLYAESWSDAEVTAAWRGPTKKKKAKTMEKPPGLYRLPDGSAYLLDEHGRRRPQWGEPFWHPVLRRTVATTEGRRFVGVDGAELVDGGRAGDEAGSYDEG
jgi:hypothetical protein